MPEQQMGSFDTDSVSAFAQEAMRIDLADAYTRLVVSSGGNARAKALLDEANAERMINGVIAGRDDARGMLAGLWLWHDWLEESHSISQKIGSETGSFWHAIMHRREGDFSNSKYWYARCEAHAALATIYQHAALVIHPLPADKRLLRLINGSWNPSAFVDLVEQVHCRSGDPLHQVAVTLQQLEWRVLFDHCARQAAGK